MRKLRGQAHWLCQSPGGGNAASIEGADAPYECFYPLPVPHKKTNLP